MGDGSGDEDGMGAQTSRRFATSPPRILVFRMSTPNASGTKKWVFALPVDLLVELLGGPGFDSKQRRNEGNDPASIVAVA